MDVKSQRVSLKSQPLRRLGGEKKKKRIARIRRIMF